MDIEDIGANVLIRLFFTRGLDNATKKKIFECELNLAVDPKKEIGVDNFFICYQREIQKKIVMPKPQFQTPAVYKK